MKKQICFTLRPGVSWGEFQAALTGSYAIVLEHSVCGVWRFYDTFDWRLFNRGLALRRSGDEHALISLENDDSSLLELVAGSQPRFAWDYPAGDMRSRLTPILAERALLPVAAVTVDLVSGRFLDVKDKTVAHLSRMELKADGCGSQSVPMTIVCLRPKSRFAKAAQCLVTEFGLEEIDGSPEQALYCHALAAAGVTPGSYSGKLDVQLDPAMRADEATRLILRHLFATMRANEAGIRADIDTEFLHDYRVAIRRTRSALSQLRGVLPAAATEHFQAHFRALGKETNELRDLDVYLLAEADYRAMLPAALQQDIAPLFSFLKKQRADALVAVRKILDSPDYERFLADWDSFLQAGQNLDDPATHAEAPVVDLARKRIYRRYRRIIKDGTYILDHTEDDLLHALRLECKNLRYLLEFFVSLFPSKEVAKLIAQLKRLQDNLGEFSDLAVQQEALLILADQLPLDDPKTPHTLIASGALIQALARRQETVKAEFAAIFSKFAKPSNQKRYRTLFGPR